MTQRVRGRVGAALHLFSPPQVLEGVEKGTGGVGTSIKQLYLDHGKLSYYLLLSPSLPHAWAWPGAKGAGDRGAQHVPERNPAGWGLPASHRWGECCQARGSGRLPHSVETRRGRVRRCTHPNRPGASDPWPPVLPVSPHPPETLLKHHLPRCASHWASEELSEPLFSHL